MNRKPPFWKRVADSLKVKHSAEEVKLLHRAQWGIVRRRTDFKGRIRLLTASGVLLNPARDLRRYAESEGLVRSGRQWVKLRKRSAREERAMARKRNAA